jgi:hypothetical protein
MLLKMRLMETVHFYATHQERAEPNESKWDCCSWRNRYPLNETPPSMG